MKEDLIMAKGQKSKEIIMNQIQKIFDDCFIDGKDLRINLIEDGEPVQIKLTLTASKTIVSGGASIPSQTTPTPAAADVDLPWEKDSSGIGLTIPTQAELDNVAALRKALNF